MAELTTLARPYARALFELASEQDQIAAVASALTDAAAVVQQDKVKLVLESPVKTAPQKAGIIADLCGELPQAVGNCLSVLAENKRLALLPEVQVLFDQFKAAREKSVEVELQSAFELKGAEVDGLKSALSERLARSVEISTSVDSSLLGGVVVRAGDTVIDGSLRGRLNKLAETMKV